MFVTIPIFKVFLYPKYGINNAKIAIERPNPTSGIRLILVKNSMLR